MWMLEIGTGGNFSRGINLSRVIISCSVLYNKRNKLQDKQKEKPLFLVRLGQTKKPTSLEFDFLVDLQNLC